MAYTYEDLSGMTVAQLREVAEGIEHDAVSGYTTMHKGELLAGLCEALGIEAHEHHDVVGIDKTKIKQRIKALKKQRDAALAAHDSEELKRIRRQIRRLKRRIKKATV